MQHGEAGTIFTDEQTEIHFIIGKWQKQAVGSAFDLQGIHLCYPEAGSCFPLWLSFSTRSGSLFGAVHFISQASSEMVS